MGLSRVIKTEKATSDYPNTFDQLSSVRKLCFYHGIDKGEKSKISENVQKNNI